MITTADFEGIINTALTDEKKPFACLKETVKSKTEAMSDVKALVCKILPGVRAVLTA